MDGKLFILSVCIIVAVICSMVTIRKRKKKNEDVEQEKMTESKDTSEETQ